MPFFYGKTLVAMSNDIKEHFSSSVTSLSNKECFDLAKYCLEFWKERFPGISHLMTIIQSLGWFRAKLGYPVRYGIPMIMTIQDYMLTEAVPLTVYDSIHKKRRKLTLRVSSGSLQGS